MRLDCRPGITSDLAPVASEPFWFFAENIRFRLGQPETIGLFAPIRNTANDEQLVIELQHPMVDFYADSTMLIAGHGKRLSLIDWESGAITHADVEAGNRGRWWFAATEDGIVCARGCCHSGVVHVIDRETKAVTPLANAPTGSIAGGILSGILILAGAESVDESSRRMIVRWSARRTDASSGGESGPFGFEDWTPSDVNSAGEIPLEHGSTIVGGGSTEFGFLVWTDTRMHLLTPRNDSYVFSEAMVSPRGLLAQRTWVEADSRVWWVDPTRTLNVYDGGGPRQIPNPMRSATVETIASNAIEQCFMSSLAESSEVILHYPARDGRMRELVYSYADNAWYPWRLDRVAMTNAHGARPAIAIDSEGRVFAHDLREAMPASMLDPSLGWPVSEPGDELPSVSGQDPTPFSWFLMTNLLTPGDPNLQSLRARNVTVSYNFASSLDPAPNDRIKVKLRSWDDRSFLNVPHVDEQELALGQTVAQLRAGGKRLQLVLSGDMVRSMIRLGEIHIEVGDEPGSKR